MKSRGTTRNLLPSINNRHTSGDVKKKSQETTKKESTFGTFFITQLDGKASKKGGEPSHENNNKKNNNTRINQSETKLNLGFDGSNLNEIIPKGSRRKNYSEPSSPNKREKLEDIINGSQQKNKPTALEKFVSQYHDNRNKEPVRSNYNKNISRSSNNSSLTVNQSTIFTIPPKESEIKPTQNTQKSFNLRKIPNNLDQQHFSSNLIPLGKKNGEVESSEKQLYLDAEKYIENISNESLEDIKETDILTVFWGHSDPRVSRQLINQFFSTHFKLGRDPHSRIVDHLNMIHANSDGVLTFAIRNLKALFNNEILKHQIDDFKSPQKITLIILKFMLLDIINMHEKSNSSNNLFTHFHHSENSNKVAEMMDYSREAARQLSNKGGTQNNNGNYGFKGTDRSFNDVSAWEYGSDGENEDFFSSFEGGGNSKIESRNSTGYRSSSTNNNINSEHHQPKRNNKYSEIKPVTQHASNVSEGLLPSMNDVKVNGLNEIPELPDEGGITVRVSHDRAGSNSSLEEGFV